MPEANKPIQSTAVVSAKDAKIVVVRLELSAEAKTHLSTGVKSLDAPAAANQLPAPSLKRTP